MPVDQKSAGTANWVERRGMVYAAFVGSIAIDDASQRGCAGAMSCRESPANQPGFPIGYKDRPSLCLESENTSYRDLASRRGRQASQTVPEPAAILQNCGVASTAWMFLACYRLMRCAYAIASASTRSTILESHETEQAEDTEVVCEIEMARIARVARNLVGRQTINTIAISKSKHDTVSSVVRQGRHTNGLRKQSIRRNLMLQRSL